MKLPSLQVPWTFVVLLTTTGFNDKYHYAEATYTIAGADSTSGQLGAAGSTCVDANRQGSLYELNYHAVPGHGLLLLQAKVPEIGTAVRDNITATADQMLLAGDDLQDIINAITDPTIDPDFFFGFSDYQLRQYGLVGLQPLATAGYTGPSIQDLYFAGGLNFITVQPYANENVEGVTEASGYMETKMVYSAQGNIVSKNTVPLLADAFQEDGCDLADRLFHAITAVDDANAKARADKTLPEDENFEGDVRCKYGALGGAIPGYGFPGLQAYIHVDDADGNALLHISIEPDGTLGVNPYDELRTQYAQWREKNPCPAKAEVETLMPTKNSTTTTSDTTPAATTSFAPSRTYFSTLIALLFCVSL